MIGLSRGCRPRRSKVAVFVGLFGLSRRPSGFGRHCSKNYMGCMNLNSFLEASLKRYFLFSKRGPDLHIDLAFNQLEIYFYRTRDRFNPHL